MNRGPTTSPGGAAAPLDSDPAFHRSLVESSSEAIAVIDRDGLIRYAAPATRRLFGLDESEHVGRSFLEFVHPDDLDRIVASFEAAAADAAFDEGFEETRIASTSGNYVWAQATVRRLTDGPGAGHFLLNLRDITPRREAERKLEEVELQLSRVVDQLPIVLFGVDASGILTLAEGKGMAALGYEPEDVIGRNVFELYPADDPALVPIAEGLKGRALRSRTELEGRVWDTQIAPTRDAEGRVTGVTGVTLDVTEAARQERSASFQALLLDSVGQAVVASDPDGRIIYWNHGAETLFGWTRDEAIGRNTEEMVPAGVNQESSSSLMAALRRGESRTGDYTVQCKNGGPIPVLLATRPVVEDGKVVALIAVASDLREMKRLEDQLRSAQKMEAVGQLAGGIAHDFNNLLTTIGGYAGMAAERVRDPQLASDVTEIVRATERARVLVDKLLAFGSRSRVALRPVDVNETVRSMLAAIRRTLRHDVRVEAELPDELWQVRADPSQLEQALMNLVVNAGEAMPEGGLLTIRTDNVTLGPDAAARLDAPLAEGEYVRVIVEDTGVGMDEAVMARVFEPFFTTKEIGQGTGLGLSTVFGVIRGMGGGIELESVQGEGTRFQLYLPRSRTVAPELSEQPVSDAAPGARGAHILLVEDEPAVRRLARRILEREGYEVTEALNGADALRRVEAGLHPDLVVTDVIMPEMGGGELARRLERARPGLPFLFMSGYTADELEDRGVEATTAFLPKPFPPSLLASRVRQALDPRLRVSSER